jgi:hypothetical protein
MNSAELARTGTNQARGQVEQRAFERGVKDGLARTPALLDPDLARSAPGLARAYGDGYQWGARHRPRFPGIHSLLGKIGIWRRA